MSPLQRMTNRRSGIVAAAILWSAIVLHIRCAPQRSGIVILPHEEACTRTLRRIWEGLKQYRDVYGVWPVNQRDPTGHEHSWRVVISPFLFKEPSLLAQRDYRFDYPWNSLHNYRAVAGLSWVFHCPGEELVPKRQLDD